MTQTILQDRAMLVVLNISQWTNRKHDKNVSKEVEQTHAAKDAGRYNKQLVDKAALDPIAKIANAARVYHLAVTLPWGNNGERLLPAALFVDYAQTMQNFKAEFENRVNDFRRIYPELVTGARTRLGSMYDALDYPAASDIAGKFGVDTTFTPVPSANDFRVNLNKEYVDKIRGEIVETVQSRQREAVKHCWRKANELVSNIHERLSDEDNKFRDSLIQNARDFVSILPALNITGDPELIAIEKEMHDLLVEPDTLRADTGKRSEVANRAAEIMERMKGYV